MSAVRVRTIRSVGFISALLLTTAISVPAMAIEEVVVTAQKTSQDIQTVPIAISAFTSNDLASHQIVGFKDLQFAMPSVHFSHGNFGPSNFQIRGIGSAAVTTSGDPGVSVNVDDVYLADPPLTSGKYFDTQRVEVLRGPQSTLFGRNATGGAINVITNKPDLENFAADFEATYGNYNFGELRAMVNIPIVTDELALRVAGFWEKRDGTIDNVYPALHPGSGITDKIDSRNDYSFRAAVRWQPSQRTTIDVMAQVGHESDSRIRAQVTRCRMDPSGVLGCLPDSLAAQPINANAGLSRTFPSDIGPLAGTPYQLYTVTGVAADPTTTDPIGQQVPNSLEKVNTDFTPFTHGHNIFAMFEWKQNIFSWLDADFLFGYTESGGRSQQSYTTSPGANYADFAPYPLQAFYCAIIPLPGCTSRVAAAQQISAIGAPINYATYFAGHIGELPVSSVIGNGTVGLNIAKYVNHDSSYDEISGQDHETNAELRFRSNFDGPFNFLLGLYHLTYNDFNVQYFVNNSGAFDYPGIILGPVLAADGYVLSPTQFNSNNKNYQLHSSAVFGEVYWDAIPDTLKFTVGARYTNDHKSFESKSIALATVQPIGTTTPPAVNSNCLLPGAVCNSNAFLIQSTNYSAWTGRGVVDWTPKLDWTNSTLVYASYSRGYRSGGFNPPASVPGLFPPSFAPETVDAYEIGTKNTLPFMGGILQANMDAWYYTYKGYQVSKIINRQSVNGNINAKLWGVEGQFFYAPTDDLQFNLNFGYTNSEIGNTHQLDTRSPTAGQPGWTLLKDALGANCAIQNTAGAAPTAATLPGLIVAPPAQPGSSVAAYAGYLNSNALVPLLGAAYAGAVTCGTLAGAMTVLGVPANYVASQGYEVSLKGNEMPSTPPWTVSFGVQYTFHLGDGFTLVPRFDYYWNDASFGTIFNDGADRVKSWDVMNAQIQFNADEGMYYARFWVQNIADSHNVTGMYVTDPSSGLFSNLFVGAPRTYGITVGAHL
jgi:outer membrane receptor protein involved in Fe transport